MKRLNKVILHYSNDMVTICDVSFKEENYLINVLGTMELTRDKTIDTILESLPQKIRKSVGQIILADSILKYVPLRTYNTREDRLKKAIEFEFANIFKEKADQLAYYIDPTPTNDKNIANCFVAEPCVLGSLHLALKKAQMSPKILLPDPVLRIRGFNRYNRPILFIHLVKNALFLHLGEENKHQTKVIPLGLDSLAKKIKRDHQVHLSTDELESVLFSRPISIASDKNAPIIEQITDEISTYLIEELRNFISEFFDNKRTIYSGPIVLSGLTDDFVCMPRLADVIPQENIKDINNVIKIHLKLNNDSEQVIAGIIPALIGAINLSNEKDNVLNLSKNINESEYADGILPSYLKNLILIMVLLTSANLFAYSAILRKNVVLRHTNSNLISDKADLSKLASSIAAAKKTVEARQKITNTANFAKNHQDLLIEFFRNLQASVAEINDLWLDELAIDPSEQKNAGEKLPTQPSIKIIGRMFVKNMSNLPEFTSLTNERFNKLFEKMKKLPGVTNVSKIKIQPPENNTILFRCELFLKNNSQIFSP